MASPKADDDSSTSFVMEWLVPLEQCDRSFDIAYWQRQGDAAIFKAAWELVVNYWSGRGVSPDELRLDRSVESIQRLRPPRADATPIGCSPPD